MITEVTIQTKDNKKINISAKQLSRMKHAIGMDNSKIKGRIHRRYEAYRNYYTISSSEDPIMDDLVSKELMTKRPLANHLGGGQVYFVSDFGIEVLGKIFDVKITERD